MSASALLQKSNPKAEGELSNIMKTFRSAFIGVGVFSGVSNILMLTGPFFML